MTRRRVVTYHTIKFTLVSTLPLSFSHAHNQDFINPRKPSKNNLAASLPSWLSKPHYFAPLDNNISGRRTLLKSDRAHHPDSCIFYAAEVTLKLGQNHHVQTMKKSSMEEHHQLPQARQSMASYHRVENVSDEVKEQAEALALMHGESSRTGRERLKRHGR